VREEEKEGVLLPLCIYQWVVPHHSLQALVDQEVVDEDVGMSCTYMYFSSHIMAYYRSMDG
jgi:hypothetical protein